MNQGKHLTRLVSLLFVNGLILIAGVILIELFWGNWIRPNRINHLNLIRNARLTYQLNGLYPSDTQLIRYTRDAYGFRSRRPVRQPIDILTIGGSTTDQRYITDGQTWQDVLEEQFEKEGQILQVVNAGVDGQSTFGHIKNFDWWFPFVPEFAADRILLYIGVNDFDVADNSEYDNLEGGNSWKSWLKEKSALVHLFQTIRGIYLARMVANVSHRSVDFSKTSWTGSPLRNDHAALMKETLAAYKKRLHILLEKIRGAGAKPVCVTQPTRHFRIERGNIVGTATPMRFHNVDINGVDRFHMMRLLNQTTMDACREYNGLALNMADDVSWDDQDFYDFFHNTPAGARKIGDYLHRSLRQSGEFSNGRR